MEAKHLRQTETRTVILTILHQAKSPLPPLEILEQCHAVGRRANKTTIYRDLEAMERAGIVRKVIVSDRAQYFELTERGHHHHFICTQCERIEDVPIQDTGLLAQAAALGKKMKFVIEQHTVEFYGQCRVCQSK